MSELDLRHLRSFVAIAETLHFGRAAERMHIAQPAISQHLRRLEQTLGVRLVARDRRGSALTEAGAAFLPAARRTLAQAEEATAVARAVARGDAGRLRAGIAPTAAGGPALAALAGLRSEAPRIEVSVRELRQGELVRALLDADVDVAIMAVLSPPPDGEGVRWHTMSAEGFVAALPTSHPHATTSPLPLAALAGEPFVAFARDQGQRYYDSLRDLCRSAGFTPRLEEIVVHEVPTQLALVAAGLGVALVPESTAALRTGDVSYVALAERTPVLTTILAWRERDDAPALGRLLARLPRKVVAGAPRAGSRR